MPLTWQRRQLAEGRQIEGDFAGVLISRRHVPSLFTAIPVDWRFEQEAIAGEQVTQSAASRTNVVEQFSFASDGRIVRTVEVQPDLVALGIDAVLHA